MLEKTVCFDEQQVLFLKKKRSCCLSPLLPSGPPGGFRARSKDTEKQTKSLEAELELPLRILKTDMDKAVVPAHRRGQHQSKCCSKCY